MFKAAFTQDLDEALLASQSTLLRIVSHSRKSGMAQVRSAWARSLFASIGSAGFNGQRLLLWLNERGSIEVDTLKTFYKSILGKFITDEPHEDLGLVIQEQEHWLKDTQSVGRTEVLFEILVPFDFPETLALLKRLILQDPPRIQWRNLHSLFQGFLDWFPEAEVALHQFLMDQFSASLTIPSQGRFQCVLLLARLACHHQRSLLFPSYKVWIQKMIQHVQGQFQVKSEVFHSFLGFLNELVPFESGPTLHAHICATPTGLNPAQRLAWSDFGHLARTRLADFKAKQASHEPLTIFQGQDVETSSEVTNDVKRSIEEFLSRGKIPPKLLEASIFRKSYFIGQFLPCLLSGELQGRPGRDQLVEALTAKGKVPKQLRETSE